MRHLRSPRRSGFRCAILEKVNYRQASLGAGILALALAAPCIGQQIKVAEGSNPSDGSAWVTLTIQAQNSYPLANGKGLFTPSLTVRCDAAGKGGKDKTVGVLLDTGGVQPGNLSVVGASSSVSPGSVTRLARESVLLRMSLDGGRPQKRRWQLLPKSDAIYQYWGEGETAVGSILSPGQFLEKILGAKLLTIEFQPFSQQATFPSQFLPAGLKQEFQHHKACGLD
jgi:hypothetical protein